ncbi:MAG: proton-conducting transporter membrane subunit, partial [Pseudomonadota bacterium]
LFNASGLTAGIVHLFNHGITKATLFMAVGAYVLRARSSYYDRIEGLGRTMPWTTAALVIAGLSLIGVPGTAGFVSKWVLVQAAFELGLWWMAFLIVGSSLLAVLYVWRALEVLYLHPPHPAATHKEAPWQMVVPIWVGALACLYFGVETSLTLDVSRTAAETLMLGSAGMAEIPSYAPVPPPAETGT